jgi:hypothetical protein
VPRLKGLDPVVEAFVANALSYGQDAEIIFTDFTPKYGIARSPLCSVFVFASLSSPW